MKIYFKFGIFLSATVFGSEMTDPQTWTLENLTLNCGFTDLTTLAFDVQDDAVLETSRIGAGICAEADLVITNGTTSTPGFKRINISYDPQLCLNQTVNPSDLSSYTSDILFELNFGSMIIGRLLNFRTFKIPAICRFDNHYSLKFDFGTIEKDTTITKTNYKINMTINANIPYLSAYADLNSAETLALAQQLQDQYSLIIANSPFDISLFSVTIKNILQISSRKRQTQPLRIQVVLLIEGPAAGSIDLAALLTWLSANLTFGNYTVMDIVVDEVFIGDTLAPVTGGVDFRVRVFSDAALSTELHGSQASLTTGQMVYFTLNPIYVLNDKLTFAPPQCRFLQETCDQQGQCDVHNEFTLFNYEADNCGTHADSPLRFDLTYLPEYDGKRAWQSQFRVFLFRDDIGSSSYKLRCTVDVCVAACDDASVIGDQKCNAIGNNCLDSTNYADFLGQCPA